MKRKFTALFAAFFMIVLASCAPVQRSSRFNSETIREGMTKEEIIKKFGKPYKENFERDSAGGLKEQWYFKEVLFKGVAGWYELNSIFHLNDGKLVRYEMGEEERLTETTVVEKKKAD